MTIKKDRTIITVGENKQKMTRKVDTYEYESLAECIKTDQVPASEIVQIFTDKKFYKYYKKNYLNK
tara:strand:- start:613 stop:810 length:198 start_codon:yes stop_codon:yes gene_type:complete